MNGSCLFYEEMQYRWKAENKLDKFMNEHWKGLKFQAGEKRVKFAGWLIKAWHQKISKDLWNWEMAIIDSSGRENLKQVGVLENKETVAKRQKQLLKVEI